MSSKLVRKGLDLVNNAGVPRSQKRKSIQKEEKPSKKRKRSSSRASKEKHRQPRGLQLSSGHTKKAQQTDFTEENLEYFKKATWKIKKDTYDKILERQNKLQRNKNSEEKFEESDNEEGGLFDD